MTVKSNNTVKELVEMTARTINKAPESIIIAVEGREVPTKSYNLQVASLLGFEYLNNLNVQNGMYCDR